MTTLFDSRPQAVFSPCGSYRYVLRRTWSDEPVVNFVMLNPSTADEVKLDPTGTRCANYAKQWGYGGLVVTNLFALRATDPNDMLRHADPIGGLRNDQHLVDEAAAAGLVVCGWGNHGRHRERSKHVVRLLRRHVAVHYLKLNGTGEPAHPLFLRGDLTPVLWTKAGG